MFLCEAYEEQNVAKEGEPEDFRTVLHLDPRLAPVTVAVLPLMKKDGLAEKAKEIQHILKEDFVTDYDQSGTIGKRYRRQDEIGTPFCVTVDHDTLDSSSADFNTVTVRFRDSMEQKRVSLDDLIHIYSERTFSRITSNYTMLKLTGDDIRIKKKLMNREEN